MPAMTLPMFKLIGIVSDEIGNTFVQVFQV